MQPRRRSPAPVEKALAAVIPVVSRRSRFPPGTTLRLDLASSSRLRHEQGRGRGARRRCAQPVVVDGQTVLPVGTELAGAVTDVARFGTRQGPRAGRLSVQLACRHGDERYDIATAPIAHQARGHEGRGRHEDRHRRRRGCGDRRDPRWRRRRGQGRGDRRRGWHRRRAGDAGQGSAARARAPTSRRG